MSFHPFALFKFVLLVDLGRDHYAGVYCACYVLLLCSLIVRDTKVYLDTVAVVGEAKGTKTGLK